MLTKTMYETSTVKFAKAKVFTGYLPKHGAYHQTEHWSIHHAAVCAEQLWQKQFPLGCNLNKLT